jgi:hypothetical protein
MTWVAIAKCYSGKLMWFGKPNQSWRSLMERAMGDDPVWHKNVHLRPARSDDPWPVEGSLSARIGLVFIK